MITTELAPSLQRLIDARLDNIERAMMFSNLPRAERRHVVAAVEDQLFEMLSRLDHEEPSREDILGILASLDPPEAYAEISENYFSEPIARTVKSEILLGKEPLHPMHRSINPFAVTGFIITCLNSVLALGWIFLGFLGLFAISAVCIPATIFGIFAVCQILNSKQQQRGLWMGIVGCASLPITAFIAGWVWLGFLVLEGG